MGWGMSAIYDVIVIGAGQSGLTTLTTIHPIQFMRQTVLGRDLHFWLTATGLDQFPFWRFGIKAGTSTSVIDTGKYKEMISNGLLQQKNVYVGLHRQD
jgi:putative flavoprotein involved in K+ transport